MTKPRCAHCRCRFVPNPRIKNQRYCGKPECQRARKTAWQQQRMTTDSDYRANQLDCQRAWSKKNPLYWQKWRSRHPKYVERNRMLQESRRNRGADKVAKMDALEQVYPVKSGSYYLVPDHLGMVAKMDASAQKVRLILMT